jgi:3-deoxy-7-phosphoheptulonate synthase/chorismate mutase
MLAAILEENRGSLPNEIVKEVFTAIFISNLKYMGVEREKKLIISREQNNKFYSIEQIFGSNTRKPLVIAGPCAVENEVYMEKVASFLKNIILLQFLK